MGPDGPSYGEDCLISARAQFTPRGWLGRFIPAVVTPAVRASVQAGLDLVKTTAQGYCPVDTGALRDSITTEIVETGSTIVGKVGPTMYYASWVEYGTGRLGDPSAPYAHVESWPGMIARPYFRPAFDESKEAIQELFKGTLSTALKP